MAFWPEKHPILCLLDRSPVKMEIGTSPHWCVMLEVYFRFYLFLWTKQFFDSGKINFYVFSIAHYMLCYIYLFSASAHFSPYFTVRNSQG